MARAFEKMLRLAGHDLSRRRRHQFVPSITGAASRLEDRALLSGAGGPAQAVAADLAATPAGRHVTRMYEHVFGSAPTQPQVAHLVREIRHGVSLTAIHKHLVAEVRAEERAAAPPRASRVTIPSAGATARRSGLVGNRGLGAMRGTNPAASPLPTSFEPPFALSTGIVTRTISITNPATTTAAGPVALNPALLANSGGFLSESALNSGRSNVPATRTTGTTGTTGTTVMNSPTGTTATTTGSLLTSLVGISSVPTPGLTTGVTGATVATSPTATITFTPATFANSPVNASPVPVNGVLPFTGTPVNPSPVPANGVLPFTGTPINPSPVPVNGALPLMTL
jgi:hypothetical protein